jgi:uncharacterized SAM-binding protein YcdF (DUF218 family)
MLVSPDNDLARFLFLSEDPIRADLAFVFGSSDPAEAARRAGRAAELYAAGYVPRLLLSGGDPAQRGRSEAAVMAEVAARGGVPADALLLEERSNTTAENVLHSRQLLARAGSLVGLRTLLLLSAWWHLRRARALASRVFGPRVRLVCCAAGAEMDLEGWVRSSAGCQIMETERALLAVLEAR